MKYSQIHINESLISSRYTLVFILNESAMAELTPSVPLPFPVDSKLGKTEISQGLNDVPVTAGPLKGSVFSYAVSTTSTPVTTALNDQGIQGEVKHLRYDRKRTELPPEVTSRSVTTEFSSAAVTWSIDRQDESLWVTDKGGIRRMISTSDDPPDDEEKYQMKTFKLTKTAAGITYTMVDEVGDKEIPSTRAEFLMAASSYIGAHDPQWLTKMSATLPPDQFIGNAAAAAKAAASKVIQGIKHYDITTDGLVAVVRDHLDDRKTFTYHNKELVIPTKPMPVEMPFRFDSAYQAGDAASAERIVANLLKDKAIRSSLPADVIKQMTQAIAAGGMVQIHHLGSETSHPLVRRLGLDKEPPAAKGR